MTEDLAYSFAAAVALAAVHATAGKMRFLDAIPRSRWLSFGGGVSIAYALVHLLPELAEYRKHIADVGNHRLHEVGLDLLILTGLATFYGLEKFAGRSEEASESEDTTNAVFWIHIGSFAAYAALIGYTLAEETRAPASLALYAFALGFHFLVNDYGLRRRHRRRYAIGGRWFLAGALLIGWGFGVAADVPLAITAAAIGFVAGGILLNTFKEELPSDREGRFGWFALGAALYAGLLLFI